MPHTITPERLHTSLSPEALSQERADFTQELIDAGLMSQEFADSGALGRFALDEDTGIDHMKHILVGDITGGCHHLRTVHDLNYPGRVIAAEVSDPNRPDRSSKNYRDEQKVNGKEIYGANVIEIIQDGITYRKQATIERDGTTLEVASGSTMFPDSWTAEDVLNAVIAIADLAPTKEAKTYGAHKTLEHDGKIDGMRIKVITDRETGKILTGSPVHRGRYFAV